MELSELATDDFQKRDGKYPAAGKPVAISVHADSVTMEFKNTSENEAKKWTSNYLSTKGFSIDSIYARQDGDYHDDWVSVRASVKA